jgi:hypothetical protein
LAKENNWDKLHALLYLRTKYESENRAEEAAIVSKLIHEKKLMKSRNMMVFNQFITFIYILIISNISLSLLQKIACSYRKLLLA